jgi:hypothetical protein
LHVQAIAIKQKKQFGKEEYRRRRRKYELTHYYGITIKDYDELAERQNNKCAICGLNPEVYLAVDHCHVSGKIRGLLCRKCNSAVGLFDNDPCRIEQAMKYLTTSN